MATIPLRDRKGLVVARVLVDDADFEWLNEWPWHLTGGYASRHVYSGKSKTRIWMHRLILGLSREDALQADHINRDRLDNRRSNLRAVTADQNRQNLRPYRGARSRFRGVYFVPPSTPGSQPKWSAVVQVDGVRHRLGRFLSEDEAGRVAAAFRAEHLPFAVEATT